MGFSRQQYWSGLPFPSPRDLSNPGIKLRSPTLQVDTLLSEPPGKPNIHWITEKPREFQKNIYFCLIDYAKAFGCVDHNKLWKILQETGIPDHLTCLLRNLYAGKKLTVSLDMEQQTDSKLGKEYKASGPITS